MSAALTSNRTALYNIALPRGSAIRLNATARPDIGRHRWDIRMFAVDAPSTALWPRLAYGSQIGGNDCDQRVDIPAQDVDCRLEVGSRHWLNGDWLANRFALEGTPPAPLVIAFFDPSAPGARQGDLLLSFAFSTADRQP